MTPTDDTTLLFEMSLHELRPFKVKGYSKLVPILRVPNGWVYFIFDHAIFVPDTHNNEIGDF